MDEIEATNAHGSGRVFVKTDYNYSSFRIDDPEKISNALSFLENVDAIAIVAEYDPDSGETILSLDWRVENVKF